MQNHPGLTLTVVGILSLAVGVWNLSRGMKDYSTYTRIMTWGAIINGLLCIVAGLVIAPKF
jgi:hypothetical protein